MVLYTDGQIQEGCEMTRLGARRRMLLTSLMAGTVAVVGLWFSWGMCDRASHAASPDTAWHGKHIWPTPNVPLHAVVPAGMESSYTLGDVEMSLNPFKMLPLPVLIQGDVIAYNDKVERITRDCIKLVLVTKVIVVRHPVGDEYRKADLSSKQLIFLGMQYTGELGKYPSFDMYVVPGLATYPSRARALLDLRRDKVRFSRVGRTVSSCCYPRGICEILWSIPAVEEHGGPVGDVRILPGSGSVIHGTGHLIGPPPD